MGIDDYVLLHHKQVERFLSYPRGRVLKLAKEGKIPCVTLPDGEIRFDEREILRLVGIDDSDLIARVPGEDQIRDQLGKRLREIKALRGLLTAARKVSKADL